MLKSKIIYGLAIFFLAGLFLSSALPVKADNISDLIAQPSPSQIPNEGLSFDSPLALLNPQPSDSNILNNIQFNMGGTISINSGTKSKSLADLVAQEATPSANIPIPVQAIETPATPTPQPSPTSTPTPTTQPTPPPTTSTTSMVSTPGGLNADDLFNMVNNYRAQNGLPALQTDPRACQVADERAPEVQGEVDSGNMHAGLKAMNLPYWNSENIITMRTDAEAFNWWINDPIHKEAILGNFKYSCVACSGNACAEEFTNFEPK